MPKCVYCGRNFDKEEAEDYFEIETCLEYSRLTIRLCGECAVQVIESEEEGVYFETCERCRKTYDPAVDKVEFERHLSWDDGLSFTSFNEYLCAECALEEIATLEESDDEYDGGKG